MWLVCMWLSIFKLLHVHTSQFMKTMLLSEIVPTKLNDCQFFSAGNQAFSFLSTVYASLLTQRLLASKSPGVARTSFTLLDDKLFFTITYSRWEFVSWLSTCPCHKCNLFTHKPDFPYRPAILLRSEKKEHFLVKYGRFLCATYLLQIWIFTMNFYEYKKWCTATI